MSDKVKEAELGSAGQGNFPKLCIPHIVCIVIEHYSDPETSFKRLCVCEKQHVFYTFILAHYKRHGESVDKM